MEGKAHPGVKNHLARTWTLGQRVDAHEVMESLTQHPGWTLLEELVDDAIERSEAHLSKEAEAVALSVDPAEAVAFAQKRGLHNGLSFHRDVVASVLDSAKTAADELKKTAALDVAAGRN